MKSLQIPKKRIFEYLKENNIKTIENYLKKGMNPNMTRSKDDWTRMIDFAAEHSDVEVLKLLVSYGANIELEEEYSFMFKAPISLAAKGNKMENVKYLLSLNVNPNPQTSLQPLTWAAENENLEMMKFLLENGADPNFHHYEDEEYRNEETPVYVLVRKWNFEGISLLLDFGAKLTKPNKRYSSPLSHAIINAKVDMVKFLLDNGAPINEISVNSSPLRSAIEAANGVDRERYEDKFIKLTQIINLLLSKGASRFEDIKKYGNSSNCLIKLVQHIEILDLFEPFLNSMDEEEKQIYYDKKLPLLVKQR